MDMLNNQESWGLMDVNNQGTISILHVPTVASNRKGDIVIRGFSDTSIGTKTEVEISQKFLLAIATTVIPVTLDPPNSVLPPTPAETPKLSNKSGTPGGVPHEFLSSFY